MIKEISKIVFDKLKAGITNSATAGLSGVKVWNEDRPRENNNAYVTFSVDTNTGIEGSAPIHELNLEVNCFSSTQDNAAQLAQAAMTALDEYSAVENGVRLASLQTNGSVRSFDSETDIWIITVRFSGLVIN